MSEMREGPTEAGREMDERVAENVMGWKPFSKRKAREAGATWTHPDGYNTSYGSWPKYSTDAAAAWQVVEKMLADGWDFGIDKEASATDQWCAMFSRGGDSHGRLNAHCESAETAAHAICLAALAAVSRLEEPK